MRSFELTEKQEAANQLLAGPATHVLLYGGSRSGKTLLLLRAMLVRALKAAGSRHAVLRFRFNHLRSSIIEDTFPKVCQICFPGLDYRLDKAAWFARIANGSEIWFGGLDEKARTEKVLGQEHATILLNEISQISYDARNIALTRLAMRCPITAEPANHAELRLKMYYDENPPTKAHWSYRLWFDHQDPDTRKQLARPELYGAMQMNPQDNAANLGRDYLQSLRELPMRLQRRFLKGEFGEANPYALFTDEVIDRWRVLDDDLPDMQRIIIGIDPSGADDIEEADNDEIGIIVGALGTDGNAYVYEDLSLQAGPATWGKVATKSFERHGADLIVAEDNFGGAMVKHVIQSARPRTPYKSVKATRGKVVRAEPFSQLYEDGKVRHVGEFRELEDELVAFSSYGYLGDGSPNRADALIWVLAELFPVLTKPMEAKKEKKVRDRGVRKPTGWMAG